MIFTLKKKWREISKDRTLKEQNEFLEDSLNLYQAKPLNYWPLYAATSLLIVSFCAIGYKITYKLMLGLMLLHLFFGIINFNSMYKQFNEKWIK